MFVLVGVLAVSLAGCAPERLPFGEATQGSSPSPDEGSLLPDDPSEASLPPDDLALEVDCQVLVSDEVIYEWGSGNWAIDPDFTVPSGSSTEVVVDQGGTACGWINLTSGEKLSVAVGAFRPDELGELRAERASVAEPVDSFGADGYFVVVGQSGQADAFTDDNWVTANSTWFLSPGTAAPIVQAALEAVAN